MFEKVKQILIEELQVEEQYKGKLTEISKIEFTKAHMLLFSQSVGSDSATP